MRRLVPLAVVVSVVVLVLASPDTAEGSGLCRRLSNWLHCCDDICVGVDGMRVVPVPPSRAPLPPGFYWFPPERAPVEKPAAGPPPVVVTEPSAYLVKSLRDWQAANPTLGGGPGSLTILVDGKQVYSGPGRTVEIRGTGTTGPVVVPVDDVDLAKLLKDALAKDTVPADVKARGARQLAILYGTRLANAVEHGVFNTLQSTYAFPDQPGQLPDEAKQLKETRKAIQAYLDDQLKDIKADAALSPESRKKAAAVLHHVGVTLAQQLP